MEYRKILFFIMCYFIFSSNVSAAICDDNHIKELKELAEQVDVNYEYIDHSDEINSGGSGEYSLNSYSIDVNLVSDELYVNDGNKDYFYEDSNNGMINFIANSGKFELNVLSKKCKNIKLKNISLNLPKFNTYSYRSECKELEEYDLDVCDPWYQGQINDNYFYKIVNKYLTSEVDNDSIWDKFINFIQKYQFAFIGGILLLVLGIIGVLSYRKRSVLE